MSENLYVRDPQSTDLGRNIIEHSIKLIDKLGFEDFTFKKLAQEIKSTEASIYRYFENKHKLLIYLIDWYWTWLEYKIDYEVNNIKDPIKRLKIGLAKLCEEKTLDPQIAHVDEEALERIMIAEFEKTFLTKQVDADNKEGLFVPYKSLCRKIAELIKEVSPDYQFPHSLSSTILLMIKNQLFYAKHLPSLSDIKFNPKNHNKRLYILVEQLVFKTIH
ncbi:MAG TPA: TetR family transcriptional regulator [Cytophagales bacterium]|nr:TetR family transcriptional regulator [Cytophagales bacterium]HCR54415.1 TetR family transcriptional regulator [Cytophagales bacterium]